MKTLFGKFRRKLLCFSREETSFVRRGFRGATETERTRLEQVGAVFLLGYHAALEHGVTETLVLNLNAVESEWRGFAFEGAAMGLALLDFFTPWRRGLGKKPRKYLILLNKKNWHASCFGVVPAWIWASLE